jgi:hypothetical protein
MKYSNLQRADSLKNMAHELYLYDVVDGGWVHEDKNFDFNVRHVCGHMNDVLGRKDFIDSSVVESEIATDSVAYALRLARWAEVDLEALIPSSKTERTIENRAQKLGVHLLDYVGIQLAVSELSSNRHDVDHDDETADTQFARAEAVAEAGKFLLCSVIDQEENHAFRMTGTLFVTRLNSLRERFSLARKETVATSPYLVA